MTRTTLPPLTAAPGTRGRSPWLRLLVLVAVGGGLASPLIVAAVRHWTAREGLEVADQFLSALRDGQAERVAALLTPQARGTEAGLNEAGTRIVQRCSGYLQGGTFSLRAPYRRNDTLTVPFLLQFDENAADAPTGLGGTTQLPHAAGRKGGAGEVVLRQAGGVWRVSGLHLPATLVSRQALEFDFERPADDGGAMPNPSAVSVVTNFDLVGPVTPEEFAAAWQTDVEAEDVPAVELLRKLAREAGRPIDAPAGQTGAKLPEDVEAALARRVSVHLHRVSRFQAIEEICRRVGVYLDYSLLYPINQQLLGQFRPGKRPSPVAFAGPFLLEARGVQEDYPNAAGQLTLALYTTALPPKIEALFATVPLSASVRGVTGPAGQDLFFAQKGMASGVANYWGTRAPGEFYVTPAPGRGAQFASISVPLKDLLRDVEAIGEVRLSLRAALPQDIHALHLEPVAVGGSTAGGGVRLTLANITPQVAPAWANPGGVSRFEFRAEPPEGLRLCWLAHVAGNNAASGWASLSGRRDFAASLAGEPVRFDFKVFRAVQEVSLDFTLRDISLPRPPRRLEPLRFEGHAAPVQVSEAGLTEKGVDLRITNHCRKDLAEVALKLVYLDAEGHVLRETARKVAATPGEGVDLSPTPRPGVFPATYDPEWRVQDSAAVPAGALSVTATVTRVLFKDGTTWAP